MINKFKKLRLFFSSKADRYYFIILLWNLIFILSILLIRGGALASHIHSFINQGDPILKVRFYLFIYMYMSFSSWHKPQCNSFSFWVFNMPLKVLRNNTNTNILYRDVYQACWRLPAVRCTPCWCAGSWMAAWRILTRSSSSPANPEYRYFR